MRRSSNARSIGCFAKNFYVSQAHKCAGRMPRTGILLTDYLCRRWRHDGKCEKNFQFGECREGHNTNALKRIQLWCASSMIPRQLAVGNLIDIVSGGVSASDDIARWECPHKNTPEPFVGNARHTMLETGSKL